MTHYTKGYAFERRISALLRERGWITTEARGSHGAWDIMASRQVRFSCEGDARVCLPMGNILLIQCKTGSGKCAPPERAALDAAAEKGGAQWYLANSPKRGEIQFWEWITGKSGPGIRVGFCEVDTAEVLGEPERSGDE